MNMKMKTWIFPLIVWIVVFCGLKLGLGSGCNDGWGSGSIGKMGACSHHGGVDHTSGIIAFIVSTTIAFYIFFKLDKIETLRFANEKTNMQGFFEMESISAPFNPYYFIIANANEIKLTYKSSANDVDSEIISVPSTIEDLKYLTNLSEKIKNEIDVLSKLNEFSGCDGECITITFFDGLNKVKFNTPMLFVKFESVSTTSLELMTYLRKKLNYIF